MDSNANGGFDFNEVIGNERVKVKAPDGAFPAGTQMKISSVHDTEDLAKVAAALDSSQIHTLFALDISFWYEGSEVEPQVPVEVTWESANIDSEDCRLVHLSDTGKVEIIEDAAISADKAVFTADSFSEYILVGTERQDSVPIEHFVFNPSSISTDVTKITSGEIAANAPAIDEYTFKNATVALAGGQQDIAIEVGAFIAKYEDDEDPANIIEKYNVFYRTAESMEASDIIVLIAGQRITLNYERTPFKVTYKVVYNGTTYTIGTDTLPADLNDLVLTGPDAVAENTTYEQAVKLSLPRGYSARLGMSNESGYQAPGLGEYSEPAYDCTDGWTVTPDDYSFAIDGVYTIANVTSNLTVTVNVSKRTSYRFSATPAFKTAYFGGLGSNARYQSVSPSREYTFNTNTTTFAFTTLNSGNIVWVMDSFNINKQTIRVPFVSTTHREDTVSTTLESGTVITMKATLGSDNKQRTYTVTVSNCYENITITGGNLHNINDKQEWVVQETANLAEFDYLADNWLPLVPGEPMSYARSGNNYKSRVIRFKVKDGYVNPQIKYVDQNGTDQYDRVHDVTITTSATDQYHLVTSQPDPDGYYYFSLWGTLTDPGLLSVRAELARYGVSYAPGDVSGAIIPGFDNGGTYGDGTLRGYNIEDNNMVALSKIVPSDPDDNYVFLNYTIDGDASQTPYAPSQKVSLATISKYGVYDSEKGEYVIPLTAHWVEKQHAETITITINFYLDTEFERTVDVQVTKGASVYVDIDSDEVAEFMDDYNWQLFYDEVGSNPYIEEALEDQVVDLQIYSKFYVYHSSTDTLELHTMKETIVEDSPGYAGANKFGYLNMTGLTEEGYYYGGYYKDYLGAHVDNAASKKNLVKEAADKNNSEGTLTTANIASLSGGGAVQIPEYEGGTLYSPVANEGHLAYWTRANAFTTSLKTSDTNWFSDRGSKDTKDLQTGGTGTAVKIARAGIYYLHEVPPDYLATPKVATVKEDNGNGAIKKMFLLSVADLNIFRTGGVNIKKKNTDGSDKKGSFAKNFTLTKYDDGKDAVEATETKTAKQLHGAYGYHIVTDGATCIAGGVFDLDPYWITYDNVTVHGSDVTSAGHVRTITVSGNTVS